MEGEEEDKNLVYFDPPLWRQRRSFVNEVLRESKVTSVVDFGCGEGSLLSFLIQPFEESPITRLAGVDINREIAEKAVENCRPWDHDVEFLRLTPLTVDIYQGSIDIADKRFLGFDALVCMEVVEHVDPPVLDKFFDIVLGTYKPKIVIVTTPNVEFNVYFPQLKYGTPEATLRIEDHRFEWTRKEFQEWGNSGAKKYNYSVEYTGVGKLKYGDPAVGNVTQIAIFRDLNPSSKPLLSSFDTYEHIEKIDFPYYNEPDKSYEEILETIHYYLQFLCNRIIDTTNIKNDQQHEPNRIKIEEIWDIHRIRQLCKTKDKLRDVLRSSSDFTLLNDEEIIVHREYHLDSYDHQEEDYDDYDDDYEYHGGDEILSSPNYNNDDQNWVTTTTNTAITTNGWPDYIGDYDSGWGDEGK
ncbi:hypothetical protein RirG_047940 [Rhizophagus irregularis DAOM 197198w]|uniref:Small RNA 2'-O-methyltransferase n=1 Tax=Rhizophagus irregularis (strain DAOM 197198w) TaxID=1432141 RepID=A0A015N6H5_RHIIW|nr:hypothetical protein RirG_047940 [Rhizophagus irregularis DAOM 197198w]